MHVQCYCISTKVCLKCFYRIACGYIKRKEKIEGPINIEWIYAYLTFHDYKIECGVCLENIQFDINQLQDSL